MEALLRVMYAPLDYLHPQRISLLMPTVPLMSMESRVSNFSPAVQQAVNYHLIQRHQLPTAIDFSLENNDLSRCLVENWTWLPEVAFLLGCKLARGNLAKSGKIATLPQKVRHFIMLPVPCPAWPTNLVVSLEMATLLGARLLFSLRKDLPDALVQRLILVFPPDSETLSLAELAENPVPTLPALLTFAFDYAKNS